MSSGSNPLSGVEAYVFDVFGTVVDWYGSVTRALEKAAPDGYVNEGLCAAMPASEQLSDCICMSRLGCLHQGMEARVWGVYVSTAIIQYGLTSLTERTCDAAVESLTEVKGPITPISCIERWAPD